MLRGTSMQRERLGRLPAFHSQSKIPSKSLVRFAQPARSAIAITPPSTNDATLVARLRAAGAIPIARTNLPDLLFAFESDNLIFGRTNNPYNLDAHIGRVERRRSGALIAACGSPFGLGSDAAGSVRLPAHYCGIATIKPTSGRLARTGHVPPAGGWIEMLWQIGPMARRVEDFWTMMPILLGADGADHTVVPMPFAGRVENALSQTARGLFHRQRHSRRRRRYRRDGAGLPPRPRGCRRVSGRTAPSPHRTQLRSGNATRWALMAATACVPLPPSIGSHRTHPLLEGWLSKLEFVPHRRSRFCPILGANSTSSAPLCTVSSEISTYCCLPCRSARQCRTEPRSATMYFPVSATQ